MKPERREALLARFKTIDAELQRLADVPVLPGIDAAEPKGQLLEDQDAIKYELGLEYFDQMKRPSPLNIALLILLGLSAFLNYELLRLHFGRTPDVPPKAFSIQPEGQTVHVLASDGERQHIELFWTCQQAREISAVLARCADKVDGKIVTAEDIMGRP